jgi:hypothetical protein
VAPINLQEPLPGFYLSCPTKWQNAEGVLAAAIACAQPSSLETIKPSGAARFFTVAAGLNLDPISYDRWPIFPAR